ncbi:Low molecular weight phosphotyrosine protein phosphatase [Azotobacter vinelandii CA]|uniref:Low molecular weight phosphotyrosine protein phosphatase n=2 Tax=Azotobacter vinelandii TaxID=354 RepID=C1DJK1_AZOVD|nr:arsenate reductase ArsC [Azotobacter vinelandii]ACO78770.1 Low molecular weight phosphotyrosine protein phosphatase [Azotobacter vinelandii DJ]AGK16618.1 Low molecular weight phosphotyrosine protein phosphatase [Azotobacter vinelandii CA]AGK20733.1 Low molecular weight phosphotyrosine protein phosphatase [Azotobacter vinelandii CA6]SFX32846.1 arsenate reductase [Azotobacter vinelandii]GLK60118.1 low molecular weight phosphatase [Azotobacter vinelandii]
MKVLFLCTANSCRSVLCEALFNHLAPAGMRAFSAGSRPRGFVHPLTLDALERAGVAIYGLASKSIETHAGLRPDLLITVCDRAAGEDCPVFSGPAIRAHWELADPSELAGTGAEVAAAFDATVARIGTRIQAFLALPLERLDNSALKAELERIGTL